MYDCSFAEGTPMKRRWGWLALASLAIVLSGCGILRPRITVNVPEQAAVTATPRPAGTPTRDPAEDVLPTPETYDFNTCALVTQEEAEAILGDLIYAPISGSDFVSGGLLGYSCQYDAEDNALYVTVVFSAEPYQAYAAYERELRDAGDEARLMESLGDDAFWHAESGLMGVRVGNAVLWLSTFYDDPDDFKRARALVEIAVERLRERVDIES